MPTVLNNIGISGDYGQIVFRNDGINNLIDLSHSNTRIVAYDMSINNILKAGQVLGTKSGKVIELSGNALLVPVGTDNQRPNNPTGDVNLGEIGMMRYNTTSNTFEGYGPTAWGSLGGVINTQQTTFVEAIDQHENPDISSNSIQFTTSGELVAVINYDGNVGIGTTNPQYLLDVYDPNQTFVNVGVGPGAPSSYGSLQLIKGDNARIRTTGSDDVLFDTNSSERMRIKDTGEVGIGTDSPVAQLDVSGDVHIKGMLTGYGTGTGGNSASYFGLRHANPVGFIHNQFLLRDNGDIYLGSKNGQQIAFFNGDPSNRANEFMRFQNGNLEVHDGDISLNGNILALGDISLNGKLYATNDVSFNENINVGGDASFNSSLSIDGDLNVDTNATISGNLDIKTNATVDNDLHVKNDATIDNDVVVNGSGTIEKDFHIKRHLTVDGSLSFLGDFIQRDTIIQVTEQMDLSNDGTGPALIVRQHGAEPVATFYDDTTMAMIIKDGGDVSFNSNVVVDGSVGIGSNAPSELLDISGGNIRLHNGDNLYIGDSITDSLRFQHITNGTSYIDYNTNNPLYFRTTTSDSSTNIMHLRENGYVGIMDSGLAGARLDVINESGSVPVLNVRQDDDAANIAEFHHGANQVMVIDNSGRLGIGITNPTQQLEVSGNVYITGNEITIDSPEDYCYFTGSDPVTVFQGGTTTRLTAQDGPIEFHAGNGDAIERARITSGGLVGIGTDDPSTRLDISNNTSNSVLAVRQHDLVENIAEFYNGANQVMVIDNSGSLGINRSDVTAGVTLDVSGAAIVSNTLRIRDDAAPEGGEIIIEGPSNSNRFHLDVNQAGHFRIFKTPNPTGHALFIDKTTNFIGLNGASPAVELDISGTGAIRIPVGNGSTQRPNGENGMIRYNTDSKVYEAYNGGWDVLGGGGGGSLTANSRRIPQGDVLFNVDVNAGTPYGATLFMVRKNAISDDGNRIVITDSTIDATDANHTYVKIYDYNPDNNQYELKQTITVKRDGNTTTTDAEGIRGVHITGDKQTILVVTANLSATDPNTRGSVYDGSYNFIPYELTNSIDVVYTPGNTLTLQNTPWYDMDDGTTLMVGERESTNSDRDVHFYSYSSSEKQFTLKQTIPYLNDISNALPNAGTAKHVAISGDGLRALWVDGTGNNVIIFKRLSTFSEFQILQTIRDIASGSTPDIHSLYTLSNFDYHGKFLALNFATSSTSKVRIYAYDEVKFNYVSASEFTNITNVNSDLITSEPYISKDGTRLFVNHFENYENGLTDNGVISMLKLDKQGKVPIASVAGAVITASAEFIMYGESTSDRFGFDTVADYHGKRIIGAGKNTNTNTSNNNVRVIQTETTILATNTTINTSEIVTLSGSLKLYPQNNIVDISATTNIEQDLIVDGKIGIGTTNPIQQLDVRGNMFLNKKVSQTSGARLYFDTAFGATGPNKIDLYNTGTSNSANNVYGFGVEGSSTTYHANQYHRFYTGASSTKTERMTIKDGNVGIGTDDPQYVLDVSGSISSSYDSDTTSYFGNAAIGYANSATYSDWASFAHIDSNSSTGFALVQNAAGRTKLNAASSQKIQFTIGNSEKMVLDSDGNVGIGTDDPRYELDVSGSITAQTVRIGNMGYGAGHGGIKFHDLGTKSFALLQTSGGETFLNCASDCSINFQVNNITKMIMDKDGNVGIGTDPSNRLTILGTNNDTVPILGLRSGNDNNGINNGAQIAFGHNGTDDYQHFIQTRHNAGNSLNAIDFYVCNGTRDNTVTSGTVHNMSMVSGNVGIGSTDPSEVLDVSGNVFINTGSTSSSGGRLLFDAASGGTGPNKIDLYHSSGSGSNLYGFGVEADSTTYHANQYHKFYTGITSSTKTERMTIKDGNVGIGTNDPVEALDVSGNIQIQQKYTESGIYPAGNLTFSTNGSGARWEVGAIEGYVNANAGSGTRYPGGLAFKTKNADDDPTTAATTKMVIDASGNVGIGTTVPRYELDVSGSITAQTVRIGNMGYGAGHGGIGFHNLGAGSFALLQKNDGETFLNCASDCSINFQVNNDTKMIMDKDGNVGIGSTNPGYIFDIFENTTETETYIRYQCSAPLGQDSKSYMRLEREGNGGAIGGGLKQGSGGILALATINDDDTITDQMTIMHNGNVGIGTTNPQSKLDVSGNVSAQKGTNGHTSYFGNMAIGDLGFNNHAGIAFHRSTTYDTSFALLQTSGGATILNSSSGQDIAFNVGNLNKMTIKDGNVGIGTNDPSEALDVSGNIQIQQKYTESGIFPAGNLKFSTNGSGARWEVGAIEGYVNANAGSGTRYPGGLAFKTKNADDDPTTAATTKMVIDASGNVGIGTTNPGTALQISSSSGIRLTNTAIKRNANERIGYIDFENGGAGAAIESCVGVGTIGNNADLRFMTTLDYNNKYVERMRIDRHGNVGIGTTDPQELLDICGNVYLKNYHVNSSGERLGATLYFDEAFDNLNNNHLKIDLYDKSGRYGFGVQGGTTTYYANQYHSFYTGTSSTKTLRMIIDNSNVGIGNTSPNYKLDIFESTSNTESFIRYSASAIAGSGVTSKSYIRLERASSAGSNGYGGAIGGYLTQDVGGGLVLATISDGDVTDQMTIMHNGNVGIGSTEPGYKLQVEGSVSAQKGTDGHTSYFGNMAIGDLGFGGHAGIAFHRSTTYDTSFALLQTSGGQTILNSSSGQDIAFNVGNLNKMTIKDSKVGIGTNVPAYPLEVIENSTLDYDINLGFAFWHNMTSNNSDVIRYDSTTAHVYGGSTANQDTSPATSILAHGAIVSKHGFWADSDSRIKTNIIDINDDSALTTLRQIQPKVYEYKDKFSRGNHTVYGFIAQQIKELLPKAITLQSRPVPSIYEFGQVTSSSSDNFYDTITFTTFNTADLDTSSNTLIVVDDTSKRHSVNITAVIDSSSVRVDTDLSEWMGAVDASGNVTRNEVQTYEKVILDASNNVILENYDIEPIASMDASGNVVGKMTDLTADNTIDSSGNYVDASGNTIATVNPDGHYIDASGNFFDTDGNLKDASGSLIGTYKAEWKNVIIHGTTTFVYGQEVDDFHVLQKEYIFTVAAAALQEVDRQLQAEKAKVSVLESDLTAEKAKTATLESQMADLLARVSALESA